jgi:hypothetical protein
LQAQNLSDFLLCRDLPDAQLGRLRASSSLVCGERIHGEPVQVVTGATALGPDRTGPWEVQPGGGVRGNPTDSQLVKDFKVTYARGAQLDGCYDHNSS